jgi:2'-5' RNA ligase
MPWDAPGSTALVALAPEADAVVGELYRRHAKAGREGMSPHVTLLVPFVPADRLERDVEARLTTLFRRFQPFVYALRRLEQFDGGILFLAPEPSQPFVELTEALIEEFPEHPPYDGIHEVIVPHLTVAVSDDRELLAHVTAAVKPQLPLECRVAASTLVERGVDLRWRPRTTFPLGDQPDASS